MPANNLFQKDANTSMVAQLIWREPGISRIEIARELSIYKSTVSNIISNLVSCGLVHEGERKDSNAQGGRKAIGLHINRKFGCVLAFDLQPSHYRSVIISIDGTVIWETKGSKGSVSMEEMTLAIVDEALKAQKKLRIPVLALAFSIPGSIDSKNGAIELSNPFGITSTYDFKGFVESHYGYPVYIENDANCAAWFDLKENLVLDPSTNALAVVADFHEESKVDDSIDGIGVGIGLIIGGKVYRGSHNGAGEFCSLSWDPAHKENQSGLSKELLKATIDSKESLSVWLEDTFRTLVPILSVFDVGKVILHGNPFSEMNWVNDVIASSVPSFFEMMKKTSCSLVFDTNSESVSALGAGYMYLHGLYSVPTLAEDSAGRRSWDEVIAFAENQR